MRATAVSGDLLVKLALAALAVAGAVWAVRRMQAGAGIAADQLRQLAAGAVDTIANAGQAVNPFNPDNVFATAANDATSDLAGRPETLGGWFRGATSGDDARIRSMLEGGTLHDGRSFAQWDVTPTGAGRANNPSAYVATSAPYSIWR